MSSEYTLLRPICIFGPHGTLQILLFMIFVKMVLINNTLQHAMPESDADARTEIPELFIYFIKTQHQFVFRNTAYTTKHRPAISSLM